MSATRPWMGVDFDNTLRMPDGSPCDVMVERVRQWLDEGTEVRVVTARLSNVDYDSQARMINLMAIRAWCREHVGADLPIQWGKSRGMIALYDDKVVRINKDGPCRTCDQEAEKSAEERLGAYSSR